MANSNQDIFLAAPPEAPTLNLAPSSDGGVAEDGLTNDSTPTLNGVTNPGALVRIFDGSAQVAQVTAALDGTYSVTLGALANGAHALTATATLAGQTSAASELLSLMIDTVAPQARFELVGRSGSRFDFDLVFSEAPAGLSINDIVGESFRGAPQVVGFAATNDPHVYRVSLGSDFIPGEMENTIRLGAGSYADAAGNPGGSASYRVTHLTYVEQNERPVAPEVVDGVTVGKVKQTTFTGPQETTYFPLLSQLLNLPLPGGGGVQLGGGLAGALTTLDVTLTPGLIPPGSGLQGVHDAATQTLLNILGGFAGGAGMPLHEFLGPLSSLPPLFAGQLGALPPLAPLTSPFTGVNLQLTSNPLSSALQPAIIQ
ncbi:Ig-like domain-containing protein, partial [Phenylobacterium sp.]|uniref:Ig-like domain-containing protein n=1 Tax=Phenylobacterium sp. TaxID=1871053 RepID=UPI002F923B6B